MRGRGRRRIFWLVITIVQVAAPVAVVAVQAVQRVVSLVGRQNVPAILRRMNLTEKSTINSYSR